MPTLKRRIANLIEKMSGNLVIPPNEVHLGPERVHLRKFFQHFEIDCVFDVGANRGQYATMLREKVGYTGPIISFEPIPELAAELKTKSANAANWFVEAMALDSEEGPATFNIMTHNEFSSLRLPAAGQPTRFTADNKVAREVTVMRGRLDRKFDEWKARLGFKRPFLKMDTQGNDLHVVEGGGARLGEFLGLQSELAIKTLYEGAPDIWESIRRYQELGFELSALVPNNTGHFPTLIEIDCILHRRQPA